MFGGVGLGAKVYQDAEEVVAEVNKPVKNTLATIRDKKVSTELIDNFSILVLGIGTLDRKEGDKGTSDLMAVCP